MLLGVILGELVQWTDLGALEDSIENWKRLEAETILIIFLPVLIFESASNIDIHVFQKALYQILLLAVPGVLINVALIGVVAKYVFPYAWSVTEAITFGAIFSATDPIAVVSLLRELGMCGASTD